MNAYKAGFEITLYVDVLVTADNFKNGALKACELDLKDVSDLIEQGEVHLVDSKNLKLESLIQSIDEDIKKA